MTFSEAVRDAFSKYATFHGRSSRSAYWWWYLFTIIVVAVGAVIDVILGTGGVVAGLISLAILLPNLAVLVRRLHDAGHSGWWVLIGLLPVIGFITLLVFTLQATKPANNWGDAPDTLAAPA
jgi:uncharacterized membrane protein YhaH (DUF805 family)